jgi:hypothetical protein
MDRISKEETSWLSLSAFLNLDNPVNPVYSLSVFLATHSGGINAPQVSQILKEALY